MSCSVWANFVASSFALVAHVVLYLMQRAARLLLRLLRDVLRFVLHGAGDSAGLGTRRLSRLLGCHALTLPLAASPAFSATSWSGYPRQPRAEQS